MRFIKIKILAAVFFIVIIFVVGVILFFYKLDSIPSGFYIDEALPSYNAYSLFKTGKDEYGKILPLFLRFYGSYNPPLYTYLTILPISKFGLSIFSARFISASAGLLTGVFIFGLLSLSGFLKKKVSTYIGTLLFVISPWVILHSRVGYEISLVLFLFTSGAFFLWVGLKKGIFLIPGLSLLSLSVYAAYTGRFLVPIFLAVFFVVFREKLLRNRKYLIIGIITSALILAPHISIISTPAFFPKGNLFYSNTSLFYLIRDILSHYITYFSPRSLFSLGDPDFQRSIPELSVFYSWMVVPYLVGIYFLFKERRNDFAKFVLILFAVSPIPASFTHDPFSTHRSIPLLVPMVLVITLGIDRIIQKLRPIIWGSIFFVLIIFSFVLLWRSYFTFLPKERAQAWGYGVSDLARIIQGRPQEHFLIDNSRKHPLYMQLAFFMKYPPDKFQEAVDRSIKDNYYVRTDFNPNYRFANFEIRNINWEEDIYKDQIIVGDEYVISQSQAKEHFLERVFEIRDPVGNLVFEGYKTNPVMKCKNLISERKCVQ